MSKKIASAQRRAKDRRRRTQQDAEEQRREERNRTPRLDRLAAWIGARSRLIRILMSALIAILITAAGGILLFSYLFTLDPSKLAPNIFTLTLVGWRVMVGFDFGDQPMQPGRSAALWLLFGITVVVVVTIVSILSVIEALGPA
jgi:ethanolamine transporter EutH